MAQVPDRVFLSYSHNEPDEVALAHALAEGLQRNGCEVFIDSAMRIGTDWVAEIKHRITEWCDAFVVLLSRNSIAKEMVQGEIRLAAAARSERAGLPRLLPIRVRYFGPLDYELESRLARIQYARWEGPDDSQRVLEELVAALRGGTLPEAASPAGTKSPLASPSITSRPLPRIDPRNLTVGGGALPSDEPLYVVRDSDQTVADFATRRGQTLVIKAPEQTGKSSLLVRYLAHCLRQPQPKKVAFVDLSIFSREDLVDYPTFLTQVAETLLRGLDVTAGTPPAIQRQSQMTWFVEDEILKRFEGGLVFAFDTVDRILGRPFQADFFTMLRMWSDNRGRRALWQPVDLVLVISTEPYVLIDDVHSSIFNVAYTVALEPFTLADYTALNDACGRPMEETQTATLWDLLGGHPYLTRLALYHLVRTNGMRFADLTSRAANEDGPFREHLHAALLRIHTRPELVEGLTELIRSGRSPKEAVFQRLRAAGLLKRDRGKVVPANRLYAQFFAAALA